MRKRHTNINEIASTARITMTILRALCAVAAVSCPVVNGQAIAGDLNPLVDARDAALSAYDSGHYERAAGYFQIAADLGDARSAETLALMYRFGPRLFGDRFAEDRPRASYWAAKAAEARSHASFATLR